MGTENTDLDPNAEDTMIVKKDGSWVPRDRMNEAVESAVGKVEQQLQSERESRIRLEEQMKALQAAPAAAPAPAKKEYTLAELRISVEKEVITQEQADTVWQNQQDDKVDKRVEDSLTKFKTETTSNSAVDSGLQAYLDILPELVTEGSDDRKKVADAYNSLTRIFGVPAVSGSVEDKQLQLAALEKCYGSAAALKQKQLNAKATAESRDTHEETGGGGGEPVSEDTNKFIKGLTSSKRKYYKRMVDSGQYEDWKAVEEEMKYAKR